MKVNFDMSKPSSTQVELIITNKYINHRCTAKICQVKELQIESCQFRQYIDEMFL